MANKSGAIGSEWERRLLNRFREQGWEAERLRLTGVEDEGDLVLIDPFQGKWIIEAKAEKSIDLSGYMREAQQEAANYAKHRLLSRTPNWMNITKRRGYPVDQAYVTCTLAEFIRQVEGN